MCKGRGDDEGFEVASCVCVCARACVDESLFAPGSLLRKQCVPSMCRMIQHPGTVSSVLVS